MVSSLAGESLVFDYPGPVRAVDDVSVALRPGELVVVLGPNGSGKSTLLRVLAGLLAPARGTVSCDGRPLASLGLRERARRIAIVPQSLAALPETSVSSFVTGGRYARISPWRGPQARDARAVGYALEAAGVGGLEARRMTDLSGGQRQRVLVARALAQEAEVLLVDEPTASLDLEHQVRVFELLARLADHERSVLVVTHDVNLASQFADRVLLLAGGRLVAGGAPDEVLRREVLEPVYGPHLHFGRMDPPDGRPFVIPWLRA
ncbi:MAG TPA: ABC transporter ATP-binding protein [Planctomycetota bacterium]|nr:ABC transporter ATP-binding protein [Planctomycetota bacterium]